MASRTPYSPLLGRLDCIRSPLQPLLLALVACAPDIASSSPPCTRSAHGSGLHEVDLASGRKFLLAVPEGLPFGRRVPMVLDWHGYSESPYYQNLLVGLEDHLRQIRWIGVLPFGTAEHPSSTCCPLSGCDEQCCRSGARLDPENACGFNGAGDCCGAARERGVNEVQFAQELIDWAASEMCVDTRYVFSMGFSNGGMLTNHLACKAAQLFRAVAPVAGNLRYNGRPALLDECRPSRSVSWLSFCGADDSVCNSDFEETAQFWSRANNCTDVVPTPTFVSATTRCETWTSCGGRSFVEKCLVQGLAHEWPGRPRPDGSSPAQSPANIDASRYIFSRWSALLSLDSTGAKAEVQTHSEL